MTRTQAIEAALLALLDYHAQRQCGEDGRVCDAALAALALPADPVPSADERERALAQAGAEWGGTRPSARDISHIIATVDATHPRSAASSESVEVWVEPLAALLDALDEVHDPDAESGTWMGMTRDDLREALARVGPPPNAAHAVCVSCGEGQFVRTPSSEDDLAAARAEGERAGYARARSDAARVCDDRGARYSDSDAERYESEQCAETIRALTPPDAVPADLLQRVAEAVQQNTASAACCSVSELRESATDLMAIAAIIQRCRGAR